jgi:hypothetical protein
MTPPLTAATAHAPQRDRARRPRPALAPPRPRRVSGPARSAPGASRGPDTAERGLLLGALDVLTSVSRHQALDRLIRGRTWIVLVAFALIGIVTLQLLVLTLNAHIGRTLVREAQLQRENATSSIESSELASGERVESLAARLGMELVQVGDVRFLAVDPRADIARAAAALDEPAGSASATSGEQAATAGASSTAGAEAGAGTGASSTASAEAGAGTGASSTAPDEQASTTAGDAESAPSSAADSPGPTSEEAASADSTTPAQGAASATQPEQPAAAVAGPLEHGGATAGATNGAG